MNDDTDVIPAHEHTDVEDDDDLVEGEGDQPRPPSKVTRILIGLVLAVLGFLGGVGVQKMSQDAAGTPILTGTVQSITGNTLKVADSSEAITEVTVPDTATVSTRGLGAPAVGDVITVTGSKNGAGVIASTVTTRPKGR
jgi:hypothetical protein